MKSIRIKNSVYVVILLVLITACAGTKLSRTYVDKTFKGKSVSNVLVIGIVDRDTNRRMLERRFVEELQSTGVKAVASADAISLPTNLKLENATILDAVKTFGNDAVIITHVISIDDKETIVRHDGLEDGFYDYYGTRYRDIHSAGYSRTTTRVRLETSLYEVKTEHLIWSSLSETWNRDTARQVIDEVVKAVVNDLSQSKLISSP